MKTNIGKKNKNNKGITLIALAITIIVLLILAGVSLSMVFSQDGIFNRAEKIGIKHENAEVYESLLVQTQNYILESAETGIKSKLFDKFQEEDYISDKGIVNMGKISKGSSKTGNGNLSQGDIYVVKQIEENGDYYLFYYDQDNKEENLGKLFEVGENDGYTLGFVWDDNVKKYYSYAYSENSFFIIQKEEKIVFKNNVTLYVAKDVEKDENNLDTWKTIDWNHKYNEDVKSGYLCDENGYLIKGWDSIEEFEGEDGTIYRSIRPDTVKELNLSYEIDGKERIGTHIDDDGKIYAKFNDGSEYIIGQISIAVFASHNCLAMNNDNTFEITMASDNVGTLGSGGFDGIGWAIENKNIKMKRISIEQANSINKHNRDVRNNNYILSINPEKEYYFVLRNENTGENSIFTKNIFVYCTESNNEHNQAIGQAPLTEQSIPKILCDKNGNRLLGSYIDLETGDLKTDNTVTNLELSMEWIYVSINESESAKLIKLDIKENGRIYGLYTDGKERLICAIAVTRNNENFDGKGEYPEENYMTISKQ